MKYQDLIYFGYEWDDDSKGFETDFIKEIKEKFSAEFFDEAFANEHSAEVQVPFIQTLLNDVNIVPILIGRENCEKVSEIVEYFWQKPDNAFGRLFGNYLFCDLQL